MIVDALVQTEAIRQTVTGGEFDAGTLFGIGRCLDGLETGIHRGSPQGNGSLGFSREYSSGRTDSNTVNDFTRKAPIAATNPAPAAAPPPASARSHGTP